MLYKIKLLDDKIEWVNERIIMKIIPNDDCTFTLIHFNGSEIKIKSLIGEIKYI